MNSQNIWSLISSLVLMKILNNWFYQRDIKSADYFGDISL